MDTTKMSLEEVIDAMERIVMERRTSLKSTTPGVPPGQKD